jgi:AcrR family transcriptional regulator
MVKRKSPERKHEILAATLSVLRTQGVTAISTAKIAAEAKCSKETIYSWFGDREGLYTSLVIAQSQIFLKVINRVIANGSTVHERLELFCSALLDMLTGDANILVNQLIISEMASGNSQARAAMLERHEKIQTLGIELLEQSKSEKLMNFENAEEAYSTLYGLVVSGRQMRIIMGLDDARPTGEEMRRISSMAVDRISLIYRV